ncbi:hypothetical protein GCM10027605_57580 [Micromonospora zhanjiangensis]
MLHLMQFRALRRIFAQGSARNSGVAAPSLVAVREVRAKVAETLSPLSRSAGKDAPAARKAKAA